MIMKNALRTLAVAAFVVSAPVASLSLIASPAYADVAASKAVVDAAKAKGVVGEGNDGYLKLVTGSADAATKAAVDEINAGRKSVYAEAAAKTNVTVDVAAAAAFVKVILPKVKPGEYYQDATGQWVKK
jgi:uncharacterized protein